MITKKLVEVGDTVQPGQPMLEFADIQYLQVQVEVPARIMPGVREGMNDFRRSRYGGPCPPIGRHRYFFKLYALDKTLGTLPHADKATLEKALQGHILMKAELVGLYQKGR